MMRSATRLALALVTLGALVLGALAVPTSAAGHEPEVRFASYNVSLNRTMAGELLDNLSEPYDGSDPADDDEVLRRWQIANVAEVIQRTRPDVILLNEFDYDPTGQSIDLFRENYLEVSQNGAAPISYRYAYIAPSNTGIPSGLDLDNNGSVGGPGDAFGFGFYEGQFGMAVLSRFPIVENRVRTFQTFLWNDMPGNLIPEGYYSDEELDAFRLSSKSHWDLPIRIDGRLVHFLVSHPTPPVFDGPEDRNGTRNHDEIRFWSDYVVPSASDYIYDDNGGTGGLVAGARFVIAGDQNADPFDGDSTNNAILQLLDNRRIKDPHPRSQGAREAAALQGRANDTHLGDPALDTADFADGAPGNLRVDYVLPSRRLPVEDAGVYWQKQRHPSFRLTGAFDFSQFQRDGIGYPTSDHRLVWVDLTIS
jgi:endonuclease/exonuclease/phosphatase family metal-dependent hydrolase